MLVLSSINKFRFRLNKAVSACFVLILFVFLTACGEKKTSDDYMLEGASHFNNNNFSAALIAYKNAAQQAPRSANVRYELGKTQLALNNYAEASKELTLALEYRYTEAEIIPSLALALARSNANVALADLQYDSSLLRPEEQVEVGVRKIGAQIDLNKIDEASKLAEQLSSVNVNTPYKGLLSAYQYIIAGNDADALPLLEELLTQYPDNRDLIHLSARLYLIDGDAEAAIALYKNYVKMAEEDLESKFVLIDLLIKQEKVKEAEQYIDELLVGNANSGILNQLKALARSQVGDHLSAKELAEKAINGGRRDDQLRLIAGLSAHKVKDYASAVKHLSVIEGTLPEDHIALQALADSKLQLDLVKDAAELLSRIHDAQNDQLRVFPRAGYELIKSGDTQGANQLIKQAEGSESNVDTLISQGALKLSMNDMSGVTDLERAYTQAPNSYDAKNTLAGAYLLTKQYNKALVLARQWQEDEPDIVEGYLLEADVLSIESNYEGAKVLVEKALMADSKNTFARLANIRIDMAMEKYAQSLEQAEALLEDEPNNSKVLASYYKINTELGDNQNIQNAISKIANATKNSPEDESLIILYASILVAQENYTQAIQQLDKIDANRFTLATYWRLKGLALYMVAATDRLIEHYQQWIALFPQEIDASLGLIQILETQREFNKAAEVANTFNKQSDSVHIKMMEAYFLLMSENLEEARRVVQTVPEKYQNSPYMNGIKARIALLEGRGRYAVNDAKTAYDAIRTSDNLELYVQTLEQAGMAKQAYSILEQHITDYPNDARSKALYALRQVAVDPKAALLTYESLLKDFPNSANLLNNAAYLHFQENKIEKAFEYSSKAYQLDPNDLNIADTYAQILIHQGETQKAVDAYNKAFTDDVTHEGIILKYIEALFKNNNQLAAERRIQLFKSRLKSQRAREELLTLQAQYSK